MNFKQWLESEYTRDTFNPDMDRSHPDIADRKKAADTFLRGDYLQSDNQENIKIINLPKTKRIVVSAYREPPIPLPLENLDVQENRYDGIKPIGGLWYAFGNDWISFTESNMPTKLFMFIHEIYVNASNMIVLNSEKEKRDFEIKYGWTGESDRQSGTGGNITKYKGEKYPRSLWINWKDVEKDYGGVEIRRGALDGKDWNEGWDIPSGCIWNKNALKDSKLLYVYNVKTKTYVKPNELGIYAGKSSKIKNPLLPTNTQPPTNIGTINQFKTPTNTTTINMKKNEEPDDMPYEKTEPPIELGETITIFTRDNDNTIINIGTIDQPAKIKLNDQQIEKLKLTEFLRQKNVNANLGFSNKKLFGNILTLGNLLNGPLQSKNAEIKLTPEQLAKLKIDFKLY